MPKAQWKPREELSEFARLIQDYLWSQRPPMTVADLANRMGISSQAIWYWIHQGVTPKTERLNALAHVTGIPIETVYAAAGATLPSAEAWRAIVRSVEKQDDLPGEVREDLVRSIAEVRERYEGHRAASQNGHNGHKAAQECAEIPG